MVFSSLLFLFLFLPVNLILYYSVKNRKVQNGILMLFSLLFYAWGEPVWVVLLVFSGFIDYLNGLFIEKNRGKAIAKLGIYSTVFFNAGLLITFKYSDFIVENVNNLAGLNFSKPGFLLPIGISFYTFQTISYTIDVYRGEVKAQRSFLNFMLFVSLFHQLVAGPVVRYSHIAREIDNRVFSWADFSSGVTRFCKGMFKKICIANVAGELCAQFLDKDFSTLTLAGGWFGIILFSIQIYFDFSGYSDMAIGLGRMFGFHYLENFNYPYLSTSVTDFWRRWHISLGSFFRDYLYIPLGGNRKNPVRNIFIVWAFTGLWHGASWNFVLWGLYFGVLLYLEKLWLGRFLQKIPALFRHAYSLFLIVIGWGFFYFTDLHKLGEFFRVIFNFSNAAMADFEVKNSFYGNIYWLTLSIVLCLPVYVWLQNFMSRYLNNSALISSVNLALNMFFFSVSVTLLVGSSYNPFLYFRF